MCMFTIITDKAPPNVTTMHVHWCQDSDGTQYLPKMDRFR